METRIINIKDCTNKGLKIVFLKFTLVFSKNGGEYDLVGGGNWFKISASLDEVRPELNFYDLRKRYVTLYDILPYLRTYQLNWGLIIITEDISNLFKHVISPEETIHNLKKKEEKRK